MGFGKIIPMNKYFYKAIKIGDIMIKRPLYVGSDTVGVIFSLKELSKNELKKIAKKELDDEEQ